MASRPWSTPESRLRPLRTSYLFFFPRFLRALRPLERWATRVPLGAQYGIIAAPEGAADA